MKLIAAQPNVIQRAIQKLAMTAWGSRMMAPSAHHLDRVILALSGGRQTLVSLSTGLPVIQVTMTGAKSGAPRTLPLVAIPDGETLLLVASNFGRAHHPGWYYNLRAHPCVTVTCRGETGEYIASEVTGAERERAFALADAVYAGYALYRKRAAPRQIHVMRLVAAASTSMAPKTPAS
jgi:deazaflavin-dependent oxidoreductase (nitroreductase family)